MTVSSCMHSILSQFSAPEYTLWQGSPISHGRGDHRSQRHIRRVSRYRCHVWKKPIICEARRDSKIWTVSLASYLLPCERRWRLPANFLHAALSELELRLSVEHRGRCVRRQVYLSHAFSMGWVSIDVLNTWHDEEAQYCDRDGDNSVNNEEPLKCHISFEEIGTTRCLNTHISIPRGRIYRSSHRMRPVFHHTRGQG